MKLLLATTAAARVRRDTKAALSGPVPIVLDKMMISKSSQPLCDMAARIDDEPSSSSGLKSPRAVFGRGAMLPSPRGRLDSGSSSSAIEGADVLPLSFLEVSHVGIPT